MGELRILRSLLKPPERRAQVFRPREPPKRILQPKGSGTHPPHCQRSTSSVPMRWRVPPQQSRNLPLPRQAPLPVEGRPQGLDRPHTLRRRHRSNLPIQRNRVHSRIRPGPRYRNIRCMNSISRVLEARRSIQIRRGGIRPDRIRPNCCSRNLRPGIGSRLHLYWAKNFMSPVDTGIGRERCQQMEIDIDSRTATHFGGDESRVGRPTRTPLQGPVHPFPERSCKIELGSAVRECVAGVLVGECGIESADSTSRPGSPPRR